MVQQPPDQSYVQIYRAHAGRVLAALIAYLRDFQLAEDALQDAWVDALNQWPRDGTPQQPQAWLLTVARRRGIDRLRRAGRERDSANEIRRARELDAHWIIDESQIPDEQLRLIFTCCHPALKSEHRVALTLHTLCGLTPEEIGRAFLTSATTMSQRLVRAKRKIRDAGIPYRIPEGEQLIERVTGVRDVIYLVYNEGYNATASETLNRPDLCLEAIRLARLLFAALPYSENGGLLSLLLLHDARRPARVDELGIYVPLLDQDRKKWTADKIEEGRQLLLQNLARRRPGPYQIQAAISAVHCDADTRDDTDWRQILGLYDALLGFTDTDVVRLNRIVALSYVESPAAALGELSALADALAEYQPFHAVHADLLLRNGESDRARAAFSRAVALSSNAAERAFLQTKRALVD